MRTRLLRATSILILAGTTARAQVTLDTWSGQPFDNLGVSCTTITDLDHDGPGAPRFARGEPGRGCSIWPAIRATTSSGS